MLDTLRKYLKYTSWPIIMAMLALMVVGVLAIRVSEQAAGNTGAFNKADKQIVFAVVSLVVFVVATVVPFPRLGPLAYGLFALTLLLLIVVLLPKYFPHAATPLTMPRKGSFRWIGVQELSLQPSELAKITYIILLAWYLRYRDNYRRLLGLAVPFVLTLIPMVLILKEPDLGTSLLFLPTLFFMLYMAGARLKHLLSIVVVASALMFVPIPRQIPPDMPAREVATRKALCYSCTETRIVSALPLAIMEFHQIERVDGWLRQGDPHVQKGKGYQLYESKMILGAGGAAGRSDWNDDDTYFRSLPEDETDFIFSVVGGQWGFLGCLGVLGLYAVIFVFGMEIASITNDPFGRLLAVGVLALLFSQMVINSGMTMGLMPVTGMTLPFISYGGSSLVVNCAALGLLVNVGLRRPILLGKRPFEYED